MDATKWVAWCPCCQDYETAEVHLKRCALGAAKREIDDLLSLGGRLALDLECLLLSCRDMAAVTRWWNESHASLAAWQEHLRGAQSGGPLANRLANRPRTLGSPMSDRGLDDILSEHVTVTDPNLRGAIYMAMRDLEAAHGIVERSCTCHPDDSPPTPCAGQYALTECRAQILGQPADTNATP